jgi:hypothetical protein
MKKKNKSANIPSIPTAAGDLPLIGHTFSLIRDGKNPVKTMAKWHQKYGPRFNANIPGIGPILVTKDPDDISSFAESKGQTTKRDDPPFPWSEVWNDHPERALTYTWKDDDSYIDGIGIFRNALGSPEVAITRFGSNIMWHVNRFNKRFALSRNKITGKIPDLKERMFSFLIDPSIQMTCGKDLNLTSCNPQDLDGNLAQFYEAVLKLGTNALKTAQNPINHLFKTSDYKKCEIYWTSLYDNAQRWFDEINEERNHLGHWPESVARDKSIFLDAYEDYYQKNRCDEKRLVCNIVEFVIGTADPGSQLMENILFQLARHPEAQATVYQEILQVFGDIDTIESITIEEWSALKHLQAFIAETCRFMPLFTIHMRRTVDETQLADGSIVPAGTKIIVNYSGMSADSANYPNPDKFMADRFLDLPTRPTSGAAACPFAAGKITNLNAVVPFGLGDRACAGIGWASVITGMAIVSILRSFKVTYHGPLNIQYRHGTPNHPSHPLDPYFCFVPRHLPNG